MNNVKNQKTEKEKKLDIIMAKLHKLENGRLEIEKEIRKMLDAEKISDLRKKLLSK